MIAWSHPFVRNFIASFYSCVIDYIQTVHHKYKEQFPNIEKLFEIGIDEAVLEGSDNYRMAKLLLTKWDGRKFDDATANDFLTFIDKNFNKISKKNILNSAVDKCAVKNINHQHMVDLQFLIKSYIIMRNSRAIYSETVFLDKIAKQIIKDKLEAFKLVIDDNLDTRVNALYGLENYNDFISGLRNFMYLYKRIEGAIMVDDPMYNIFTDFWQSKSAIKEKEGSGLCTETTITMM